MVVEGLQQKAVRASAVAAEQFGKGAGVLGIAIHGESVSGVQHVGFAWEGLRLGLLLLH